MRMWSARRNAPLLRAAIAVTTLLIGPGNALAASFDHLECYKLRDLGSNTGIDYTLDLDATDPAFGVEAGCRVRSNSREICVAADKTNVTPAPFDAPPGPTPGSFLCYRMRCARGTRLTVAGTDQLGGTRTLAVARNSRSRRLCVPLAPTTTTTSTSTATTSSSTTTFTTTTVTSTTSP